MTVNTVFIANMDEIAIILTYQRLQDNFSSVKVIAIDSIFQGDCV